MIKVESMEVWGFEHAIRGMRNPMNSWNKSDSDYGCRLNKGRDCVNWDIHNDGEVTLCKKCQWVEPLCEDAFDEYHHKEYIIGPNDLALMKKLTKAGPEHRKFLRQIFVSMDITAPLYWWKEFDTYKIGTTANSCSTMHKIHAKAFTLDDFSHEHLDWIDIGGGVGSTCQMLKNTVRVLNECRDLYLKTKDKYYWRQMIQLLPSSYNQRRTVTMTYENALTMIHQRKEHKLDEWRKGLVPELMRMPYMEELTV